MRYLTASILLLLLAVGCSPQQQKELKPGEKAIILSGTVEPVQEADITAPVGAPVSRVLVEVGKRVRAGEVVVELDTAAYRVDVAKAEAAVAVARAHAVQAASQPPTGATEAEIAQARAEVEQLRQEVTRQRRLSAVPATATDYEQAGIVLENAKSRLDRMYALLAQRLVSRPEVETVQNEYAEAWRRFEAANDALERRSAVGDAEVRIAEARLEASEARLRGLETRGRDVRPDAAVIEIRQAEVKQAEADLARARFSLSQAAVVTPIGGTVTEVKAQVGQRVYERDGLVHVVDIERVLVRAELSPGLLPYVRVGQKAQVTISTVPPTTLASTIQRVQPVADPKTQSLGLALVIPNPEFRFQPGFSARVEIPVEKPVAPGKKEGGS